MNIDGVELTEEAPTDQPAFAARVKELSADGAAIYPVGGGTGMDFGTPPARPGVALSLSKLDRVVDYPIKDLTITVEAGMTVAKLHSILASNHQRVPVDVPNADRATIGGALAVDAHGPRRLGHGRFRDWVIGMTTINDRGDLCKSGGRVVKNVAGYDMAKLMIGASGGLGIISQITFKLQPMPASAALVAFPVTDVPGMLDKIHASKTRPAAVELITCHSLPALSSFTSPWAIIVLFEDNAEAVAWQVQQISSELTQPALALPMSELQTLIDSPAVVGCELSFLAAMKPSEIAEFVKPLAEFRVQAHALSGIVRVGETTAMEAIVEKLPKLGHTIVRRCPGAWKSRLAMWGPAVPAIELIRNIKKQLDPRGVLNPGRTSYG